LTSEKSMHILFSCYGTWQFSFFGFFDFLDLRWICSGLTRAECGCGILYLVSWIDLFFFFSSRHVFFSKNDPPTQEDVGTNGKKYNTLCLTVKPENLKNSLCACRHPIELKKSCDSIINFLTVFFNNEILPFCLDIFVQ